VPGLIRVHRDGEEDSADVSLGPPVEPLFSNEGAFRKIEADRSRRKVPLAFWIAGIVILAFLVTWVGSAGTAPAGSAPATHGSTMAPPIAAATSGGGMDSIMGASDLPGSTTGGALVANGSQSAGGPSTVGPSPAGSPGRSSGPGASSALPSTPSSSPGPSGGASAAPSQSSSATRTPTVSPTPVATPTPIVAPTPTPVITPPPALFVSFEPDGTTSGGSTATSAISRNSYFILFVDTLPGAACTMSEPSHASLVLGTASGSRPALIAQGGHDPPPHPWWAAGAYTVTVTCILSGYTPVSATKVVQIT
jgi:hypothetical protein